MGIIVTNPVSVPELVYSNIHLDEMCIELEELSNVTDHPVYKLRVRYRLFAVDPDGNLHYAKERYYIVMPDYLAEAITKAQSGDMDMLTAFSSIEQALAQLIEDQNKHGAATPI